MDAKVRRQIEMGKRALLFSREHPEESPGYQNAVTRLEELLQRADRLLRQQLDGTSDVRAAALRKVELRREMKLVHLPHLASAAVAASRELPELHLKFEFPPTARSFRAFRAAAGAMLAVAERHKDLLERYGLADLVLRDLVECLAKFDDATARVTSGRLAHVGARAELRVIGREVLLKVQQLNGPHRVRYSQRSEALAAWSSASRVERAEKTQKAENTERAERADGMEGPGLEPAA